MTDPVTIRDMRIAVDRAKYTLDNADDVASDLARLLQGRLRHVSPYILKKLKKELRDFNMHTGNWKD